MAFFCIIGGIIVSKIGVKAALMVSALFAAKDSKTLTICQISSTGDIMFVDILGECDFTDV